MRILQIVADGNPGGGTTHVLQILSNLQDQISLALISQSNSYIIHETKKMGIPTFEDNFFTSWINFPLSYRIKEIVREFSPDLVHIHGGRAGFFYSLAQVKTPTVYTVHGYHFLHKPRIFRNLSIISEKFICNRSNHVIFVSDHDRKLSLKFKILPNLDKASVIYNGVSLENIPFANPASKAIGFIGRLVPPKDPLLFLEVAERLPGYSVIIIGGGELEDKLKEEIHRKKLNHVKLLGSLAHEITLKKLAELRIIVMTSLWEGLPILALEAMWSGVPVVATRVGGLGEIIENGSSGLLIDNRSPDDFANEIKNIESNPSLRKKIIKNARLRILDRFSEREMLKKIYQIYCETSSQ